MGYDHLSGYPGGPRVPQLSDVPYLCKPVGQEAGGGPRAPQGPSDEELNRITPDPQLPPFGGSQSLFMDLVAGSSMLSDRASGIMSVRRKQT